MEIERAMQRVQGRALECPCGPRHRWTRWEGNTSTAEALQCGVLKDQESVSPALHWWHWLYCHSVIRHSHQEPPGRDAPSTVASRLKALFPSKIKSVLGYAKSVSSGVMMVQFLKYTTDQSHYQWGNETPLKAYQNGVYVLFKLSLLSMSSICLGSNPLAGLNQRLGYQLWHFAAPNYLYH